MSLHKMSEFPDGIPYYTRLELRIQISFPKDKVVCQYCRLFCRAEENFKRYSCRLTDEWLLDPFHERGQMCPLTYTEEEEHDGSAYSSARPQEAAGGGQPRGGAPE